MNHLGRLEKNADPVMQKKIENIRNEQTDKAIKSIYDRHRDDPMIKWKKEIKKVVGIPLSERNGMDA